jgi:hypothetical protein
MNKKKNRLVEACKFMREPPTKASISARVFYYENLTKQSHPISKGLNNLINNKIRIKDT